MKTRRGLLGSGAVESFFLSSTSRFTCAEDKYIFAELNTNKLDMQIK